MLEVIIQGRYDGTVTPSPYVDSAADTQNSVVCPVITAWELHKMWPEAKFTRGYRLPLLGSAYAK
jgi:hypothetical protein